MELFLSQFGFRTGKSTEDAVAHLTSLIYEALDNAKPSLGIFIDLAKAFDTVSHQMLLQKLDEMGIRDLPLKLIQSYLEGRKQLVQINSIKSKFEIVKCGVPQGTILNPLLFICYLNNLFRIKTSGEIVSFADDTVIFYTAPNWKDLKHKAEKDFVSVKNWLDSNLLTINLEKTLFVPFACTKNSLPKYHELCFKDNTQANSENVIISSANSIKYLGIIIDSHLRWDIQLNQLTKKLRGLLYPFFCLKDILNIKQLKTTYQALVESHIRYAILGWGGVLATHLKKIEIIQKKFLKLIFNKNMTYSSNKLYKESEILDPRQLYFFALIIKIYKNPKTFNNHKYETRNNKNLYVESTKKKIGQRSHTYLAPRAYNILPEPIKDLKSQKSFAKASKQYLQSIERSRIHDLIEQN